MTFSQSTSSSDNPSKNIIENLSSGSLHSLFLQAADKTGITALLSGQGPYTVFAPVNDAFNNLNPGEKDKLLSSDDTERLKEVLQYHIIQGKLNSKELARLIKLGNGFAVINTINNKSVTVSMKGSKMVLKDENGETAIVSTRDLSQQNGVLHFIDGVLQPK